MHRRQFLTTTMGLALSGVAAPAIAQAKTKVRVGYLHTLAVDGQIWTGMDRGSTRKASTWSCASSTPASKSSRP
jgi:NitT/TauT family transport system substrate-binding protein